MTPELSRTLKKIALVSAGSFVFAFSLVPLYNAACEKVFGIKLEQGAAGQAQVAGVKPDDTRTVRVQFDGTVNSKLAWDFKPQKSSMDVHPGRQYEALFVARNRSGEDIVGNAAPSIAPNQAAGYFAKTECFCFTEQRLAAGEQRDRAPERPLAMVRDVIDAVVGVVVVGGGVGHGLFRRSVRGSGRRVGGAGGGGGQ